MIDQNVILFCLDNKNPVYNVIDVFSEYFYRQRFKTIDIGRAMKWRKFLLAIY